MTVNILYGRAQDNSLTTLSPPLDRSSPLPSQISIPSRPPSDLPLHWRSNSHSNPRLPLASFHTLLSFVRSIDPSISFISCYLSCSTQNHRHPSLTSTFNSILICSSTYSLSISFLYYLIDVASSRSKLVQDYEATTAMTGWLRQSTSYDSVPIDSYLP